MGVFGYFSLSRSMAALAAVSKASLDVLPSFVPWLITITSGTVVSVRTTHSQLTAAQLEEQGIKPNTVRLSIGTEHIEDILADLQRGFDSIA